MHKLVTFDRQPVEVIPNLYIGSTASVVFSKDLQINEITHVLSTIECTKFAHIVNLTIRNRLELII